MESAAVGGRQDCHFRRAGLGVVWIHLDLRHWAHVVIGVSGPYRHFHTILKICRGGHELELGGVRQRRERAVIQTDFHLLDAVFVERFDQHFGFLAQCDKVTVFWRYDRDFRRCAIQVQRIGLIKDFGAAITQTHLHAGRHLYRLHIRAGRQQIPNFGIQERCGRAAISHVVGHQHRCAVIETGVVADPINLDLRLAQRFIQVHHVDITGQVELHVDPCGFFRQCRSRGEALQRQHRFTQSRSEHSVHCVATLVHYLRPHFEVLILLLHDMGEPERARQSSRDDRHPIGAGRREARRQAVGIAELVGRIVVIDRCHLKTIVAPDHQFHGFVQRGFAGIANAPQIHLTRCQRISCKESAGVNTAGRCRIASQILNTADGQQVLGIVLQHLARPQAQRQRRRRQPDHFEAG